MAESHSSIREGVTAGAIGAAVIAIWYFIFDVLGGRPLYTPNAIADRLFGAESGGAGGIGIISVVTIVHFAVFMVAGTALTAMVHLASRHLEWRMGVLLAFVIGAGFFAGLGYAAGLRDGAAVPHWKVLGGAVLSIASIVIYLWRTHPRFAHSFSEVPLGDETDSVPHAPNR
ncbi:MAG TPA: hypothetical protein VFU00_06605 [Gemmatimonadales bacterium]|nr:hypothetical protein [Gemmatimonadales bacterium]